MNWNKEEESRGVYNNNSDIKFKTIILKSSLCNYSDAYILVTGRITITGDVAGAAVRVDERDKRVIFKNCAPFNCKSVINNTEIDNAKDTDIVMSRYDLIEYSHNYSKTSESLWQYYRDESNDKLTDSESFKSKIKVAGKAQKFWRTLEMLVINCEINLILTWLSTCVITNSTVAGKFQITDTKLYVLVVTLSTEDSAKLLQQLKSGFNRTISWNRYKSDPKTYA